MNENKGTYDESERMIDLLDMALYLLKRWRSFCMAVVLGVLAGGIFCLAKVETVDMSPEQAVLTGAHIVSDETQNRMRQAIWYRELYEKQTEYLQDSYIMQMDSNKVYTGIVEYYLAEGKDTRLLSERLKNSINDELFMYEMRKILGMDKKTQYLRELLDCSVDMGKQSTGLEEEGKPFEEAVITYTVFFGNRRTCDAILQAIQKRVENLADEYQISSFEKIDDYIELRVNKDFMAQKKSSTDSANTYMNNYLKIEAEFSTNDRDAAYYNIYYLNGDTTGVSEFVFGVKKPIDIKTMFLQLIAGIVLACGIWGACHLLKYFLDQSVRTAGEVTRMYGLSLLGYVVIAENKKNSIDIILAKLAEKYSRPSDSPDYVRSMIDSLGIQNMVICGELDGTEQLWPNDLRLKKTDFVHKNGEALQDAIDSEGEIIVVRKGKTLHKEMQRELDVCRVQKIRVVGVVVVG